MTHGRNSLLHWLGADAVHVAHGERWLAAIGTGLGIACCWIVSKLFLGPQSAMLLVASMGAGAVLLFAVPGAALSQPWPAIGGHLISALIGVSCAQWFEPEWAAAASAVALAVLAMHYGRCLHPPGGATALVAVIGGADVHSLGYAFVLAPVMLNAVTLFAVALLFNNLVPHRRYPAAWAGQRTKVAQPIGRIRGEDLRAALRALNRVEDISEEDLLAILEAAANNARARL